jgi:hypothetical protein
MKEGSCAPRSAALAHRSTIEISNPHADDNLMTVADNPRVPKPGRGACFGRNLEGKLKVLGCPKGLPSGSSIGEDARDQIGGAR